MAYRREAQFMLFATEMFVALTSIACGVGLALGVIQFPLTFLRGTQFSDYTLPGLVMAVIVGGSALLAAAELLSGSRAAIGLAALAGLALLAFEVAEITLIDQNTGSWLPLAVAFQSAYAVLSLTMLGLAVRLLMPERRRQPAHVRHASTG